MSDAKDKTIALNARLKPGESLAHPRATNYTNVAVAQGIAYLDFGFIEPTLLAAIAKTAKDGQAAPKGLEGAFVTLVARNVDMFEPLHQQVQRILAGLRDTLQPKPRAYVREEGTNETCAMTRLGTTFLSKTVTNGVSRQEIERECVQDLEMREGFGGRM
jgi:hypothetical protein